MSNVYTGCVPDTIDERDYIYEDRLGATPLMTQEEWEKGYDIEKVLNFKIPSKNQYNSLSCTGQGTSYYWAVLNMVETGKYDEGSAKAIYSQVYLYGGGAQIRDAIAKVVEWGEVYEKLVKSYKNDGTTDEVWMTDKSWITPEITSLAKTLASKDYTRFNGIGIDLFANAIKNNHGCVFGVELQNNGTWFSSEPKAPDINAPQNTLQGHCLYGGKLRLKDGKKQIGIKQSWGDEVNGNKIGEDGWQWLNEEWFENNGRFIFNPWTLVDKPNYNNDMIFKKEKNSPHIWMVNEEKKSKVMIADMPTLNVFGGQFEEVESLSGYTDFGTMAWFERVIN